MSESAGPTAEGTTRYGPFQFGIKHLFGLTFLLAVLLSTTVGLYPYSMLTLPWFLGGGLIAAGYLLALDRLVPGPRSQPRREGV